MFLLSICLIHFNFAIFPWIIFVIIKKIHILYLFRGGVLIYAVHCIYIYIYIYIYIHHNTVVAKIIRTLVFWPVKISFKSVISIFCCSVSVGNISLHFQALILPLIVIIQWYFCLHKESDNSQCSTQRSDLIIIQSVWNDMKKQNKQRQTQSRRTVATSPRCFNRPTCKATWKTIFKCTEGKSCFKRKAWSHQMLI